MIDRFVQNTHAVVPKPNPAYKPGAQPEKKRATIYELFTAEDMA